MDARSNPLNFEPMLASKFDAARAVFPCYVQPKINGIRCWHDGLDGYSKYGNPFIRAIQVLLSQIDRSSLPGRHVLDGELYIHGKSLQQIASAVTRGQALTAKLRYYVFGGLLMDSPHLSFDDRWKQILKLRQPNSDGPLRLVETFPCPSLAALERYRDAFIAAGFEGLIYRRSSAVYRRGEAGSALMKWPKCDSAEFLIVGANEASGKDSGTPVFACETASGERFDVSMEGTLECRRQMWMDRKELIGKPLTVRFKELTDRGVPREQVGVAVRDYEGRPAMINIVASVQFSNHTDTE